MLLRIPRIFPRNTFLVRSYKQQTKIEVKYHPLTIRSAAAIGNTVKHPQPGHRRFFSSSSLDPRRYNVAIVGTGPSGFYTAKYLLSAFDKMNKKKIKEDGEENVSHNNMTCTIDMIERLPTPYGLVRYGVAPDHPEVKNVENDFSALFQESNNDNSNNKLNFWGNVAVGENVSVEELRQLYDVVVLAYGCESDRKLGIPGEDDISGVLSAREFVAWYNGHPYFDHIGEQVASALNNGSGGSVDKKGHVVVIGQGNVALDCARILAKGSKGLNQTDIAKRALSIIGEDGVPLVTVVGRRGHVQGAFTIKELRELTKLEEEGHGANFVVREDELDLGATASSQEELAQKGSRPKVRIDKLLREAAAKASEDSNTNKEVRLRFLLSPKSFEPNESNSSTVGSVVCERTKLEGDPGKQVAVGTGELETIPAQLVLVSIGYKGIPLPGLNQWFDDRRGIVVNKGGKVDDATDSLGGLYVSGWLKRGPSGIIGTNIMDAKDTVVNIVRDLRSDSDSSKDASQRLLELLNDRNVPVVRWSNFEKIDAEETSPERKRHENQPREKITDIQSMLDAAQVS